MKNGKFVYTRPGSDEVIGEVEIAAGYSQLARIYLSSGGFSNPDNVIVGYLAAYIAGEANGIDGIELGGVENITEETVAKLMCKVDVYIEEPEPNGVPEAEVDENPTATSGATS